MKKVVFILLAAVLAIGVLLVGCGEEEPTATPTATPTVTPTATPTAEPTAKPTAEPTAEPTAQPTTPGKPAPSGTILVADPDFGWESTDPVYYESFIGWAIYDALLNFDAEGNIIPWVAESFSLEGSTWTFKIRKGIKWHNGEPLTAHDVKFSVDRFGDMSLSTNPWSWYISDLYNKADSIVVDDYTYQFVSAKPEPAQSIVFAWTRILPKNYYESLGMEEYRKKPMGSGPWKFVELIPETKWTVEANTDYWIPEAVPEFQYVTHIQMPEEATRIAAVKAGEVDIALGITYDRLGELMEKGYRTVEIGFPTLANFTFQGTWLESAGPTGDIRVRQAMSYALNRQEIIDTWFAGLGEPGGQFFMHPGSYGYTDALEADPYDPDKARALLAEAGYPDAWDDPTIHFYTVPQGQDYILLLFSYWEEIGLQMELEVVDSTVNGAYFFSFTRLEEGAPNAGWMFNWIFGSYFNSTYHASNMYCSWGVHNAGNDPTADELYLKATSELDPDKARQYYAEFQAYAKTLYVNVGVARVQSLVLVGPKLGEFTGKTWVSLSDCYNGIKKPK